MLQDGPRDPGVQLGIIARSTLPRPSCVCLGRVCRQDTCGHFYPGRLSRRKKENFQRASSHGLGMVIRASGLGGPSLTSEVSMLESLLNGPAGLFGPHRLTP